MIGTAAVLIVVVVIVLPVVIVVIVVVILVVVILVVVAAIPRRIVVPMPLGRRHGRRRQHLGVRESGRYADSALYQAADEHTPADLTGCVGTDQFVFGHLSPLPIDPVERLPDGTKKDLDCQVLWPAAERESSDGTPEHDLGGHLVESAQAAQVVEHVQ
jgi:hypothetical protein